MIISKLKGLLFFISIYSISTFSQVISGGGSHSLFLCSSTIPTSCGFNYSGQLGNNSTSPNTDPNPYTLIGLSNISDVVAGDSHSIFLRSDGTVWICGDNSYGELGLGTNIDDSIPVQIPSLSGIIAIAAGDFHSLFLKNDGTVWACGFNNMGQLGDGTTSQRKSPIQVTSLNGIIGIAAGAYHSLFLKSDSTVWACGQNLDGQLGNGTTSTVQNVPVKVDSVSRIKQMAAGRSHSIFLKNDSTVWACGYNTNGQLGDGTNAQHLSPIKIPNLIGVIGIETGYSFSLFLKKDSTVSSCGWNSTGALGDGTNTPKNTPGPVNGLTGIIAISGGYMHSLFLKSDGSVWGCGSNSYGQLCNLATSGNTSYTAVQTDGLCSIINQIEKENHSLAISIYPIPAKDRVIITSDENTALRQVVITSALGEKLATTNGISNTIEMDINNYPAGFYYLQMNTSKGIIYKKIIKL